MSDDSFAIMRDATTLVPSNQISKFTLNPSIKIKFSSVHLMDAITRENVVTHFNLISLIVMKSLDISAILKGAEENFRPQLILSTI